MICESCKRAADLPRPVLHQDCPGKGQCTCQHKFGPKERFIREKREA